MNLVPTLALAFVAGMLTILSPCVLPLAPVVVASARSQDPRGPIALALGLAATFGLVGEVSSPRLESRSVTGIGRVRCPP